MRTTTASQQLPPSPLGVSVLTTILAVALGVVLGVVVTTTDPPPFTTRAEWLSDCWTVVSQAIQDLLVPLYTVLVLFYLAIVALRSHLLSYEDDDQRQGRPSSSATWSFLLFLVLAFEQFVLLQRKRPRRPSKGDAKQEVDQEVVLEEGKEEEEEDESLAFLCSNLPGAYKLLSNDNFEGFLEVQGVPWALRRAANQARPVHRIRLDRVLATESNGNKQLARMITIRIEGIIESQTSYIIGGPPVETNVRGRIFQDQVSYYYPSENNNNNSSSSVARSGPGQESVSADAVNETDANKGVATGIFVSKLAVTENYNVTVRRELSPDKQEITMTSTVSFRDGRDPVQCIQKFSRIE